MGSFPLAWNVWPHCLICLPVRPQKTRKKIIAGFSLPYGQATFLQHSLLVFGVFGARTLYVFGNGNQRLSIMM